MSQMVVHSCFQNVSEHGYKSSILKSGICKYTRRNEPEKMKWCVMEMSLFHKHPKGTGLVTNLINRLKILIMEELSFHEIALTYYLLVLLKMYEDDRTGFHYLYSFCDLVFKCKRNRYVSYHKCWWNAEDYKPLQLPESRFTKYRVSGDSDEIAEVGETLVYYIETKDELMFSCFKQLTLLGTGGKRFNRKEASYLWFSILQDYMITPIQKYIFDFALNQYHKKTMTERNAFAIWLGLFVWKQDILTKPYKEFPIEIVAEDVVNTYLNEMKTITIDDYVIQDYHVNSSKYGLSRFAKVGALVIDEYLEFDPEATEKRSYYIKAKHLADKKKLKEKKVTNKKPPKSQIEFIDWDMFSEVTIIEEGVCGGKVCCISVMYQGSRYILKEMKKSMNYGLDYILIDKCKPLFQLQDMNMKRIKSNRGQLKLDPTKKSFVGNVIIGDKECIYCMMDYWEHIGDLGKHKYVMKDESVKRQALKIRLFDGLFRSSDNILRNILVNQSHELLSIDEGDIFGKRAKIFNKTDWFTKPENYSKELVIDVINDLLSDIQDKLSKIRILFRKYHCMHYEEFKTRFTNYQDIVLSEFSLV